MFPSNFFEPAIEILRQDIEAGKWKGNALPAYFISTETTIPAIMMHAQMSL